MNNVKVLIIGGNSFLGYCLTKYIANKFEGISTYLTKKPLEGNFVRCNLLSKPELFGLGDFDCVIQYSSIIVGKGKLEKNLKMVNNAVNYSKKIQARYIYISSSQVNFPIDSEYKQSKVESENIIKKNSNNYIIIRPAAPYGSPIEYEFSRKQGFHVLAEFISKSPFVPVIGDGKYLRQPVHIDNLNRLIDCSILSKVQNKIFEIGGPRQISFNEIIDIISNSKSRNIFKTHFPKSLFKIVSNLTNFIDAELVNAVNSDEKADNLSWQKYFDINLVPFEQGVIDI